MEKIDQEILSCLEKIKGNGMFVCNHTANFIFPNFEIEGFGELSYPINEWQAKGLISIAQKAPFGKGDQTIIDEKVRSAWEIDAQFLHFKGDVWNKFLGNVLSNIKVDLGVKDYDVDAKIYKLLIYEKGDFFLSHKDSEKEKGMFGTLIIGLPSKHSGGELLVEFDREQKIIEFDRDCSNGKIPYVAFYADCNHEVRPLESGHRIVLVYNLIQKKTDSIITVESTSEQVDQIKTILLKHEVCSNDKPKIFLLGHQYTPENFSLEQLKLNDRAKANILLRAAKEAGSYANLCLITSYIMGSPLYHDDDDCDEMDEIFDESVEIQNWQEITNPILDKLGIQEDDLLATFTLNEGEPLIKENSGYMGNYGPDISFWYHYGAVVLWSKQQHAEILLNQSIEIQLKWLNYYNNQRKSLSNTEWGICDQLLQRLKNDEAPEEKINYTVVTEWFVSEGNKVLFESFGFPLIEKFFVYIDADSWIDLLQVYGKESIAKLLASILEKIDKPKLAKLIEVCHALKSIGNFKSIIEQKLIELPGYFKTVINNSKNSIKPASASTLKKIFDLEFDFPQDDSWVEEVSQLLLLNTDRNYINDDIIKCIISRPVLSPLTRNLLHKCTGELKRRVDNKPQPFTDWSRALPESTKHKNQFKILEKFISSPYESAFDFKTNQVERSLMENAIVSSEVDLEFETIRKGSPHTLRIMKNHKSYNIKLKLWLEDLALYERVMQRNNL